MTTEEYAKNKYRQAHRERYARLKAAHMCYRCMMIDGRTLSGKTYCAVCAESLNAERRESYLANREKYQEKNRKYVADHRANCLCVKCGKSDTYTENGWPMCFDCLEKARIEYHKKRHPGEPIPGRRW